MAKVILTIVSVIVAVGVFSGLWVGANLLFSQVGDRFRLFATLVGSLAGMALLIVLDGNRLLTGLVPRPETLLNGRDSGIFAGGWWVALRAYLFWPVIGAAIGAALGWALATLEERIPRLAVAMGGVGALGLIVSFSLETRHELDIQPSPLMAWTGALVAVGAALSLLRRRPWWTGALTGAMAGWLIGAFGGGIQDGPLSNQVETTAACVVAGLLLGARLGLTSIPDVSRRAQMDDRGRAWLFVGPGVGFIAMMLIIPAIQTFLLSLQHRDADNLFSAEVADAPGEDGFVGLDNYRTVFSDPKNLNTESVNSLFTSDRETFSLFPWGGSELLPWAAFFAVVAVALALLLGRETGQRINVSGAPILPALIALGLFSFALFTHVRGTIINNLWWAIAVTLLATSLGLAVAKLADGARFESMAKSFVFMPMAISFVGASIIWRLIMYRARNISKDQTGVFNALWVWLGRHTTGDWGAGKVIIGGIFLVAAAALILAAVRAVGNSPSMAGLYAVVAVIPLWVGFRAWGSGIGGYAIADDGTIEALPVDFVQDGPYNNFFLMIILIWIQTGFAMVILSAAIKAVPGEFIEAAKIDGATDGQIFWRITIPSIAPTIGVVATTIMVNVMKVFDIVKVTTNGQFGSQVLANAMWEQGFLFGNRPVGATLAVLIFIGVFPVMVLNILRLTREEA